MSVTKSFLVEVELFDKILYALDSGQIVTSVFLDLAKAFDTVDHAILVKKLDFAGIRGVALNLFESYLKDRKQTVYVNNSFSDMKSITCGVPQGSVLGPLLFLIYINDIGALNLKSDPNIFADDTAMFYFGTNILSNMRDAQSDLDLLREYFRLNKLTLNVGKSKFMNIHSKSKILPAFQVLQYDNVSLEEVNEFKYLGIVIDKHLVWDKHIIKITKKISCRVGLIRKLSYFLPKKILLSISCKLLSQTDSSHAKSMS